MEDPKRLIKFPKGLVATKYPGYYYHPGRKVLYSIKRGRLHPLPKRRVCAKSPEMDADKVYWRVSDDGVRKYATDKYLDGISNRRVRKIPYIRRYPPNTGIPRECVH